MTKGPPTFRLLAASLLVGAVALTLSACGAELERAPAAESATPAETPDWLRDMATGDRAKPQFAVALNTLDPGLPITSSADTPFDPSDDYWGLPRTAGYEDVDAYCGACHSLQTVMQQRVSPERWAELLDWMVETQGMTPLAAEDRKTILAYLSEHFSDS
ncbi:MAG: hypothetical protein AAGL49_03305 [Pseudomonadota bacterium]